MAECDALAAGALSVVSIFAICFNRDRSARPALEAVLNRLLVNGSDSVKELFGISENGGLALTPKGSEVLRAHPGHELVPGILAGLTLTERRAHRLDAMAALDPNTWSVGLSDLGFGLNHSTINLIA